MKVCKYGDMNDRKSLELAEINRLNELNAEMLAMLKDVAELMADDTGELYSWIDAGARCDGQGQGRKRQ